MPRRSDLTGIDISRIKAICFDVDGTLSDTDNQYAFTLRRWLRPLNLLFPRADLLPLARWLVMKTETPGTWFYGLPDRLHIDGALAYVGEFFYRLGLGKGNHPFLLIQGIDQMIVHLSQHYPLAVVSARGYKNTLRFLDHFRVKQYFTCIATAHTCKHTKPHPDPIIWAAEKIGVSPESCLMVGDTVVDMRAGKAAGAQTVGVLCGFGERAELLRAGADHILETTADLVYLMSE